MFVLVYVIISERRRPGAAFAFALFLYGTSIVGPVRGGVYNLFEPVTALAASAIWLGQSYHITELAGTAAILTGIAILTIAKDAGADVAIEKTN